MTHSIKTTVDKPFDFNSIRKKFETTVQETSSRNVRQKSSPIMPSIVNNSLENLNNSTDPESTDESDNTVLELDPTDAQTDDQVNSKKYYIINNSKYTPIKSCSVNNIFTCHGSDFLKYSTSVHKSEMSKSEMTKSSDQLVANDGHIAPLTNSERDILNDTFFDNSNTNNSSGYLEPIGSSMEEFIPMFPFPKVDVKSRTDLADDCSDESIVTVEKIHAYCNDAHSIEQMIDDTTKTNQYDLLNDFIKKEQDFNEVLRFFYEEFCLKIKKSSFILLSQKKNILTNITDIYDFHTKDWLPDLMNKSSNWQDTNAPTICDIFTKHLDTIRHYDYFIDNFKESLKYLDAAIETKPLFRSQIEVIYQNVRPTFLKLASRLRFVDSKLPIIKILFFYLQTWPISTNSFLIKYENYLTVEHPDFLYFDVSVKYFNDLATKSTEIIEEIKQFEILKDLQMRLGKKYNILDKKRVVIKEGPVATLSPHLGNIIRIYVVLLNDLLIICDQADNEFEQLKPKRPLDVIGMLVSSEINTFTEEKVLLKFPTAYKKSGIDAVKGFSLNVPCVGKVFKFYARNMQEKKRWYNAFVTVAQANRFGDEIDRTNVGLKCPKFIPEKLIQYCSKCKSEFSKVNRKHHCKACGLIFCKNCSKMNTCLQYDTTNKKNRICDFCYDQMFNTYRSKLPSLDQVDHQMRTNLIQKY